MSKYNYCIIQSPDTGMFTYVIEDTGGTVCAQSHQHYPTREQAESIAADGLATFESNKPVSEHPEGVVSLDSVRNMPADRETQAAERYIALLERHGVSSEGTLFEIPGTSSLNEADRQGVIEACEAIAKMHADQLQQYRNILLKLCYLHPDIADKL